MPKERLLRWMFWVSVAGITVASLLPRAYLPEFTENIWDKWQHFSAYGWMAGLGGLAYSGHGRRVALGLVTMGAVLEVLQTFVENRQSSVLDEAANVIGVAIGLGLVYLYRRWRPSE